MPPGGIGFGVVPLTFGKRPSPQLDLALGRGALFVGYALQADGLRTITSSTSAFITALYVPLAPLSEWAVFRRAPKLMTWIGVGLAFVGLILLSGGGANGLELGVGEAVTLVSTIGIAGKVILIGFVAGMIVSELKLGLRRRRRVSQADGDGETVIFPAADA